MVDISAVICTFNRASLLEGAINNLCNQLLDPGRFEILVIDNASTDTTSQIVARFQALDTKASLRYLFEVRQGLGIARNQALAEARGKWIAFLDDDARAAPDYLEKVYSLISQNCQYLCVGGPIYPFYTTNQPLWFKDIYETHHWGQQARLLNRGESFSGSNMVWRREALELAGGFNEGLGVRGSALSIGEETDVFKRIWQRIQQPQFYYSPDLIVHHWVPPEKMSVQYQLKRFYVIGRDAARLDMQPGTKWRLRTILRSSGAVVLRASRALFRRYRYRYWQNWAVEEGKLVIPKLGLLAALLGYQSVISQRDK